MDRLGSQLGESIEREGKLESEKLQLNDEKAHLQEQVVDLSQHIQEMEQSTSWRLTRPLRSLGFRLQASRAALARGWVQFRLRAILTYHRMSLRHPGIAWTLRRIVRPFFSWAQPFIRNHSKGHAHPG